MQVTCVDVEGDRHFKILDMNHGRSTEPFCHTVKLTVSTRRGATYWKLEWIGKKSS